MRTKKGGACLVKTGRADLSLLLTLFLLEFTFLLGGGVLVLLVFRYQVVHVGLSLSELHLIHTLTSVPVEEGLPSEHSSELFTDSLEQLLDGGGVTNEGGAHLQTSWWNVTDSGLHVVGDPFNKVAAVLVLNVQHLLVNLLHGHASSEHGGYGEVTAVSWVTSSHHVLGIKHLLGKLWDGEGSVLLATSAGKWGESRHEKVETWEWHHVDGELSQVGVELTWESQTGGDT